MKSFITEKMHLLGIYPVTLGYNYEQDEVDRPDGLGMNQVFLVSGGSGEIIADGENASVRRGDMFFLRKNVAHYYSGNEKFKTTYMGFDGEWCDKIFEYYKIGDSGIYIGKSTGIFETEVKCFYEDSQRINSSAMLSVYAHKIVTAFFEEVLKTECTPVEAVKNFIELNYNKPLSFNDIMEIYPYSKAKLCRDFLNRYKMTVFEMITKVRLEHAETILKRDPHIGLKAVSARCGFNDVSYFCRMYKRYYGKTAKK